METETWDVFISHASEDKEEIVEPLYDMLEKLGLKVWYDKENIRNYESIPKEVSDGLKNSTFFIIIYSENFFKEGKSWTMGEEETIVYKCKNEGKKVIPFRYNMKETTVKKINSFIENINAHIVNTQDKEEINKKIKFISEKTVDDILEFEKSNLKNILKKIDIEKLQNIAIDNLFSESFKNKIKDTYDIENLLKFLFELDCDFIPILKKVVAKKYIESKTIENYIRFLKLNQYGCDKEKEKYIISKPKKIIGIVVDIGCKTDIYSIDIGIKYEDNTFVIKKTDVLKEDKNEDNIFIEKFENKLSELLQ